MNYHVTYIEDFGDYAVYRTSSAENSGFYCWMGRNFADAGIRKELGGPMTDSVDHVWLVATAIMDGERTEKIVAFSGCRFNNDRSVAWFTETYVFPAHRRKGLFGRLFGLKFDLCAAKGARVVKGLANASSLPMFERHGWRVASVRGSWTYFEKEVSHVITV